MELEKNTRRTRNARLSVQKPGHWIGEKAHAKEVLRCSETENSPSEHPGSDLAGATGPDKLLCQLSSDKGRGWGCYNLPT